jgi:hypothetical protein
MPSKRPRKALRIKPTMNKEGVIGLKHAGELHPCFDLFDPRNLSFDSPRVDVDLRECVYVRAQAALWCVVYLALASERGARCRLLVPIHRGVSVYLKTLGMFDWLKESNVEVDDRDIHPRYGRTTVLPITLFRTVADVSHFARWIFQSLRSEHPDAEEPIQVLTRLFGELAMNAVLHSESEVGVFGCVEFSEIGPTARFTCAVADGGIGLHGSMSKNDALRGRVSYDWDSLELAVRERVSGTGNPQPGIGLNEAGEDIRQSRGSFLLHSGMGSLAISGNSRNPAHRTRLFPGTLAFVTIPA